MLTARRSAVMMLAVTAAACSALVIQASGAVAAPSAPAAGTAASPGGTWRTAREAPGTAALNQSGFARVRSVSCTSSGNCSAGGFYWSGNFHPFVASQVNGTWRAAVEVAGAASLNQGGNAEVNSVACASPGNCSAGGYYTDFATNLQAFVVNEVNGTWHTSIEVPGTGALNQRGGAAVGSVSCASAGNCSAGGWYMDGSGFLRAFVVSEVNGTWHTATKLQQVRALRRADVAAVTSVSCRSAGNCSAGGYYWDASGLRQAFVVSEVKGTWHRAMQVPGTARLNRGGDAMIDSVSCGSAGNCSAGGYYTGGNGRQAFVVSEVKGAWRRAIELPGNAAVNKDGSAQVSSVSCASAGNCSAGGFYHAGAKNQQQAFVANQVKGTWHRAIEMPGTARLNKTGNAAVYSVSCPSAGRCTAGGYYSDRSAALQAFVVSEINGTWRVAAEVPGTGRLNKSGGAAVFSVSCAAARKCSAGGSYQDGASHTQAFVVSKT